MRVDAHQHYWAIAHRDYGWLQPTPALAGIYRDFGPADLHPLLDAAAIQATVLVQAAPSEAETGRLLALAEQPGSRVAAVIGWCDLLADDAAQRIARWAGRPLFKGLRPMLQDLDDPRWILQAALRPAFGALRAHGLVFEALVKGDAQIDALCDFVERQPELAIVVDHGAKPAIARRSPRAWALAMRRLARSTRVHCKLSGLVTEAGPAWTVDDLRPYADCLIDEFGPRRLLWGSDWPVVNLAGGYGAWHEASQALLGGLAEADRERVFGGNAQRVYGL